MARKKMLVAAAIVALTGVLTHCASTGDPERRGVEDLERAVEEHLPGLGNNPTTDDDPYHR